MASNEELAKDYFTVERLIEREDVQKFAGWVDSGDVEAPTALSEE